ncbi:MAG: protein-L-isoaspartate(D-aspartate) O-methyltransferase [Gammaproteobacteria bacterium]|nr:protein-L-isoaspartate(D-aspartate) O-methyltransferase [Gammaproteobacteria bacterium]
MFGSGMTSALARGRLVDKLAAQDLATPEVLEIMREVPRHVFVDEAIAHRAYDDTVLPIGFQQTISQPTIVAMMTNAAAGVADRSRALEIGTGCGYQTTVLSRLFDEVYTVERIEPLQLRARRTLANLEITNVTFKFADGYEGWPENSPFNAVIGTASAAEVPLTLCDQVALHGRLIMPVANPAYVGQSLVQWERTETVFRKRNLCGVRFVPMLRGVETTP